jgi:farnesyl-diphosphate farnesyltransferase
MNKREEMVRQVSRTFALSIEQLPDALREAVSIAYLMFRVSDGIEDHALMSPERKISLLESWAAILEDDKDGSTLTEAVRDLDESDPEVEVIQNTPLVLSWLRELPPAFQEPIIHHVQATSLGMARWQAHGPFVEDEPALDDYMHEVAGRVGYLVTDLFSLFSPRIQEHKEVLMPLSRECGLALQTVNVIRGICKDYERGWVFIPQSYLVSVGLSRDTLLEPKANNKALALVAMLADKADRHLENGLRFVTTFPRYEHGIRLALMWPFFFAVRTLAISRNNPDVLRSEAKMTRSEVQKIVAETKLFGWSNRWLEGYYQQLAAIPAAQPSEPRIQIAARARTDNQT